MQAGDFEALRNERGRLELLAAALGLGVNVPAERDQLLEVRVEEGVEGVPIAGAITPSLRVCRLRAPRRCVHDIDEPAPPARIVAGADSSGPCSRIVVTSSSSSAHPSSGAVGARSTSSSCTCSHTGVRSPWSFTISSASMP